MYMYTFCSFFLVQQTVQYCNRIIIVYITDIFIVTLLQFFFDFMIIFKNVAQLTYKYFTLMRTK